MPAWLKSIVRQATGLSESIAARATAGRDVSGAPAPESDADAEQRLARWRHLAAEGDSERFGIRLALGGFDEKAARLACRADPMPSPATLPDWAELLHAIGLQPMRLRDVAAPGPSESREGEPPLPFAVLFFPAVDIASARVRAILEHDPSWATWSARRVAPAVWRARERALVAELVELAWRTLYAEFDRERPAGRMLFEALRTDDDTRDTALYDAFVTAWQRDNGAAWFERHPALARLIATRTLFWIESTAELLVRVKADWNDLERTFARGGGDEWRLVDLSPSLSDSHQRGRSVMTLTFNDGTRVVHKPKPLLLAARYNEFLAALNASIADSPGLLTLKTLRTLDRGEHGWVEFAPAAACADETAATRYYFRAGELLCLAHVMLGSDFHFENLIACAEDPVLVDVESLFHIQVPRDASDEGEAAAAIHDRFWSSVIATGLLPRWNVNGEHGIAFDVSGLGCVSPGHVRGKVRRWRAINTDAMRVEFVSAETTPSANLPHVNGRPALFGAHVPEFVAGFRAMYRHLVARRTSPLLARAWERFRDVPVRFIFRPTKVYSALLQKALDPGVLRHGVDRSLTFEALSRGILGRSQPERLAPLLQAEIDALEIGDVPWFSTHSTASEIAAGLSDARSTASAFDDATRRLHDLDEVDLEWQCDVIAGSAHARIIGERQPAPAPPARPSIEPASALSQAGALREAVRIGDELVARAWGGRGRALTWLGFSYFPPAGRFQFEPLGWNLYDGAAGVALFLSALGAVTGNDAYAATAARAVRPIGEWLRSGDAKTRRRHARRLGLGGLHGLGSVIYSLARIGEFSKSRAWIDEAVELAAFIDSETIAASRTPEIMTGTAGALLALLRLHAAAGEAAIATRARECADRLASERGELRVAGFAHGACGIAHALRQAHARFHDVAYLRAAEEIESRFRTGAPSDPQAARINWCQGLIGRSLVQLAARRHAKSDSSVEFDVGHVVGLVTGAGLQRLDHVCCGNFGLVEFLLAANRRTEAATLAGAALSRSRERGGFELFGSGGAPVYNPGFFQGVAGIGYSLLRLHDASLPCALLLE